MVLLIKVCKKTFETSFLILRRTKNVDWVIRDVEHVSLYYTSQENCNQWQPWKGLRCALTGFGLAMGQMSTVNKCDMKQVEQVLQVAKRVFVDSVNIPTSRFQLTTFTNRVAAIHWGQWPDLLEPNALPKTGKHFEEAFLNF